MTEYKANIVGSNRDKPFTGTVLDTYIKEYENNSKYILEFEEGNPHLFIKMPEKAFGGDVGKKSVLGILIKSLDDLKIDSILDVDETGIIENIRHDPDINGKKLLFDCVERIFILESGEQIEYLEWRVTKTESSGTPAPKPQSKETPAKEPADKAEATANSSTQKELWEEIILDVLSSGSMSEGGIMKAMKIKVTDKAEQKKMNDIRRLTIETMATDGIIKKTGNEFELV